MGQILVEGSARHVHITAEAGKKLFGEGYSLHKKRDLSQPGEFLTEEKVTAVGPKGRIERISVLGPERVVTQVELSLTDARTLGIEPPIRESGNVAGSAAITLIGTAGTLELTEGAIIAKRHVHLTPDYAGELGINDKDIVSVKVGGERGLTFGEVVARVSAKYASAMHLDFDEMNAAGLSGEVHGEIIK